MKLSKIAAGIIMGGVFIVACERPSAPDFTLEQQNNIPILKNITYEFLGGKGALVDTTSSSFEDLFLVDPDGTVRIVQELEFEIGELDDVIPEIEVDPITIESAIGDIVIDDFSAEFESEIGVIELDAEDADAQNAEVGTFNAEFSGSGTADYQEVTGSNPDDVPSGTPLPAGESDDIIIELEAGDFQEAVIESGAIRVVFRNELGFNINTLTSELLSDGEQISQTSVVNEINHNDETILSFPFENGDELKVPLAFRVRIDWLEQNTQADAGSLVVREATDDNLIVSSATADIPEQVIEPSTPNIEINNPNFEFAILENSSDPNINKIRVSLVNQTQLPLTNNTFSGLPTLTLRNSDGEVLDSEQPFAVQGNVGATSLDPGETGVAEFDLSGAKLTKVLSYDINVGTTGGDRVTVNSTDFLIINAITTDLEISEVSSDIDPQSDILLQDEVDVEGDFVNAEVESGVLNITFTNDSNIPLVIDNLVFENSVAFRAKNTGRFFETGSEVGRISNLEIPPNSSVTESIDISGKGISNRMRYDGSASSPGTTTAVSISSSDIIRTGITGEVTLSSATAILDSQDFNTSGIIEIDDAEFRLTSPNHFVEISSGILNFTSIINQIDLDLDTLIISFPDIRRPGGNFSEADSLVISFIGDNRIQRRSANVTASQEISLAGHRIYAIGNELRYNVVARTEETRGKPDEERTVRSTDMLEANVQIQNLRVGRAFGEVSVKSVELTDGEGPLDLFNDNIVQITDIEDLKELSSRISNIRFFNPSLNLTYTSNIGVDAEIYAAILGVNESGEEVFLSGINDSPFTVVPTDTVAGFLSRGAVIPVENLIKFRIDAASVQGESVTRTLSFNSATTNVEDFLSSLPTSIRFVGKALVNPDGGEGFVVDPIDFSTTMGIDVPLNFATASNPGIARDTVEVDLSDLPSPDDDLRLISGKLNLLYNNGLPLDLDISMEFLDENFNLVTSAPLSDGPYRIAPASVDPATAFVTQTNRGVMTISLNESQLNELYRTRHMALRIQFQSTNGDPVKIRATDTFSIGLSAEFSNRLRVD
ncbi:MAG: hypothetical protein JJU41_02075 [Bacteroidetes bacterium]|nr:hypothetical protein [Bacteroidota bacterium]MCH8523851.1 hypothetical protein [Balneolales bacterium]